MAVTIRWTQRAAGRDIGDVETVERSVFVDGVIAAGRVEVLAEDLEPEAEAILAAALESPSVPRPNRSRTIEAEIAEPAVTPDEEPAVDGGTDPE